MLGSYSENAGYRGDATFVRFTVGCHTQPCALMTDGVRRRGFIFAAVFGATVTVNDATAPKVDRLFPTGLNSGGTLGGDEPLTFDASDNSGITRVGARRRHAGRDAQVVGAKDLACDYSFATPVRRRPGPRSKPRG